MHHMQAELCIQEAVLLHVIPTPIKFHILIYEKLMAKIYQNDHDFLCSETLQNKHIEVASIFN